MYEDQAFEFNQQDTAIKQYHIAEKACIAAEQLVSIAERIQVKKALSSDDAVMLRMATESAYSILGVDAPKSLALESYNETRTALAVESILEDIGDVVKSLGSKISWFIKKDVDNLELYYTFFEGQSDKLHKVAAKIEGMGNSTSYIRTTTTKYLRFGDNQQVKDFEEYTQKYLRMSEVMCAGNKALVTLKDKDWLQSLKVFLSPLTGYDDKYHEQWTNLHDFVGTIQKAVGAKSRTGRGSVDNFYSENLLGMSHFEIKLPAQGSYDIKHVDTLKKTHKHMWAEFTRDEKFELGSISSSVLLEKVTKKDLLKCVDASYDMIASYKELMSIRNKLSLIGERYILGDAVFATLYPLHWWKALLANYRIMVRLSTMQFFITGSMFNFTRGNIAKFLSMADKGL